MLFSLWRYITKFLVFLLLFFCMADVHADFIWPTAFILIKWESLPIIITGLLLEIGFVKYFTKVRWKRAVIVATVMNAVSATLGAILVSIIGLLIFVLLIPLALILSFLKVPDELGFVICFWLIGYICATYINVFVEGKVIHKMLKLPLSKTFHWLFFVNAITAGMCIAIIGGGELCPSRAEAIGIPMFVICIDSMYLIYRHYASKKVRSAKDKHANIQNNSCK